MAIDLDILEQDVERKRREVRRLQQLDDVERARDHDEYSSDVQRGGPTVHALLAAEQKLSDAQWALQRALEKDPAASDKAAVRQLIIAMQTARPHLDALEQLVGYGDSEARALISDLERVAEELTDVYHDRNASLFLYEDNRRASEHKHE